jgi:CBS domain-containing protein
VVGPIASALIGVGALLLASLLVGLRAGNVEEAESTFAHLGPAATLLMWLGPVNIGVAIFNLIPGFPLDGGRILRSILWKATGDVRKATRWAATIGQGIGWMFIVAGIATMFGMRVPFLGGGMMGGMWTAFIGWFLTRAAAQSIQAMELKELFSGVPVARAMRTAAPVVSSDASIGAVVDLWFTRTDETAIPVDEHGRFVGMLTLLAVKAIPRERWETTPVRDVMMTDVPTVAPTDDLTAAIEKLGAAPLGVLPVVEDGALVGLLEQRDIARWLDLYGGRPSRPWTEATRRR